MMAAAVGTGAQLEGEHGKLDLATTSTLVTLSFLHFLLVIPVVISGIFTRILFADKTAHEETRLEEVANLFASLLNLSALANGTSFYVYLARIPSFRNHFCGFIYCRCRAHT